MVYLIIRGSRTCVQYNVRQYFSTVRNCSLPGDEYAFLRKLD